MGVVRRSAETVVLLTELGLPGGTGGTQRAGTVVQDAGDLGEGEECELEERDSSRRAAQAEDREENTPSGALQ